MSRRRKFSAASGISPTENPEGITEAEGDYDDDDDDRMTLYMEHIGYVSPRDHREMELYIAAVHRDREEVIRIDHFIGPASRAKISSITSTAKQTCSADSRDSVYQYARRNRSGASHETIGVTRNQETTKRQSQGARYQDTVKYQSQATTVRTSPPGLMDEDRVCNQQETATFPFSFTMKQRQILGIGMEYPEPPPGIRQSSPTNFDAYRSRARGSNASLISGVSSGYGAPSISTVKGKAPSMSITDSELKPETLKERKSSIFTFPKFPSFLRKDSKLVQQSPSTHKTLIEHVTHNNTKDVNHYIANSNDQKATLQQCLPPVLKKYGAEAANQQSEAYLAHCIAIDPYQGQFAQHRASRACSPSLIISDNTSSDSVARPFYQLGSSSSFSIGEVYSAPNLPFARGIMHRHSADALRTRPSNAQPPRRNTSALASHTQEGNARGDNHFWFKTITENDISFPTHRAMGGVLPLPAKETQPDPDEYRRARDEEIRRVAKDMADDPLPIDEPLKRKSLDILAAHRGPDVSNKGKGKLLDRNSDARPASRFSEYSDEDAEHSWHTPMSWGTSKKKDAEHSWRTPMSWGTSKKKDAEHSWRTPMSWGTSKKKDLYHTFETRDKSEAIVSDTDLAESAPGPTSKFKLFGSALLKKGGWSKGGTSASVSVPLKDLSPRTSPSNSTGSVQRGINPEKFIHPHPGSVLRGTDPERFIHPHPGSVLRGTDPERFIHPHPGSVLRGTDPERFIHPRSVLRGTDPERFIHPHPGSVLRGTDPQRFIHPHPGTQIYIDPPQLKARKVIKQAFANVSPVKREERREQRRRDGLKQQISLPVQTTSTLAFESDGI